MDVAALIAEAMTEARGKYRIVPYGRIDGVRMSVLEGPTGAPIDLATKAACEAHLERLVAVAVLRALQEAGCAVVTGEPEWASLDAMKVGREWREIYRGILERNDLIPPILIAAGDAP